MNARRILSLLLALAMVITLLPMPAHAEEAIPEAAPETEAVIVPEPLPEEPDKPERFTATIPFQVNPLYEGLYTPDPEDIPQFPKQEGAAPQAANYQTVEEASKLVRTHMKNRNESYTVYVKTESSDYNAVFSELLNLAVEHTGVGNEGDYLMWHLAAYGAEVGITRSDGYYNYTYDIVTPYYTTAAQEQELTNAVNNLISSLGVRNKSDYEKVCAVYDYMCANITYDYANLEDTSYGLKFSAYAALVNKTAVCQGYALLFYRIMLELGIDARFIGGDGGGPHAWNIVNLGDYYYNVDATWDAGLTDYQNFLKSTWTFYNHYRDPEFDYWEFHMDYPMAAADYVDGETATLDPYINMGYCGTEDMGYANAIWAMKRDGTLVIEGEGAMHDYHYSTSSMPYWYYWVDHIEKVEVGEGITRVGNHAFYQAAALKEVSLPDTLTAVGSRAFAKSGLTAINLPEGLTTIGDSAFEYCSGLTEVEIPGTVTNLEGFGYCENLKKVILNEGTTTIASEAFRSCTALADINFPASLRRIETYAFQETALTEVNLEGIATIETDAFAYCNALTELTIPASLDTYSGAFRNCGNLKVVTFEEGITVIPESVFGGCSNLTTANFPSTLKTISGNAFSNCTSLAALDFPDGLTSIGSGAFDGCISLTEVDFPDSLRSLGSGAFMQCTSLTEVTVPNGITVVSAFRECSNLVKVNLPDTVTTIGRNAFSYCTSLAEINMPYSLEVIDDNAFERCIGLQKLVFSPNLKEIGFYAFYDCENLKELVFRGDCPEISFQGFHSITATVYYPANNATWTEDKLADYAGNITWVPYTPECTEHTYEAVVTAPTCQEQGFTTYTCTNCGDSYVDDYTDPVDHNYEDGECIWCGEQDALASGTCGDNLTWVLTEDGALTISGQGAMYDYYDNPTPWQAFLDEITTLIVEEGATQTGSMAFQGMRNLIRVTLPESLTDLGNFAFLNCSSLENIDLPGNLQSIGQQAFCNSGLKSVVIPASVTFLDASVFDSCVSLTDVLFLSDPNIPSFSMGNSLFRNCTALEEIRVEEGHLALRSIDGALYFRWDSGEMLLNDYPAGKKDTQYRVADNTVNISQLTFERNPYLEELTIPATVNTIGSYAFMGCSALNTLRFEGGMPDVGSGMFWNMNLTISYPCDDSSWNNREVWNCEDQLGSTGSITWQAAHQYVSNIVPPTCTEQGYTTYTCTICNHSYADNYTDPLGHNYTSVVTEPTCEEGGYTTYTCTRCDHSYVGDHTDALGHIYEDGHCRRCGEEEYTVRWYSGTTSLKGTIDLNMYVILSENLVNDPEVFVRFSFEYRQVDVPMADALESTFDNGVVAYRFSCPLYAKQVADEVVVQVMRGDTPVGEPKAYSAMQYCKNLIRKNQDPKQVAMCKAMLNYATAAQLLFNYHTDNLANASLSDADKNLPDVDASAFKYTVSNNQQPGIKAKSATMMMESEIRIRVYFELKNGHSIEEYTFTIDGVEVQPQQNADGWFIESEGILAKEMENMHDFCFGGITVHYGALSYVNSKLKSDDPLEVNLAKALYAYYIAAEALLG